MQRLFFKRYYKLRSEASFVKVQAFRSVGDYNDALQAYQAIDFNPQCFACWEGIGVCLDGLGKYIEAIQAYNQAIQINPQDAIA